MSQKRKFIQSAWWNKYTFHHYVETFRNLALSSFQYENVPETMNVRFLEQTLFDSGVAVVCADPIIGLVNLRCTINAEFNVYGEPIYRTGYGYNGYNIDCDASNSVIIYNNMCRTNTLKMAELYAMRLWDLDRTIDVNARAQKTPVLVKGTNKTMLTWKNIYQQIDGNSPAIFVDNSIDPNSISVFRTDAPFMGLELQQLKNQLWNEALTNLGIANLAINKKERLVSDEVARSQGGTLAMRNSRLFERQKAVDEINAMFGTNITVKFAENLENVENPVQNEGGVEE